MHFDDSFFQAETICDFHVRGMMKRYWASGIECLEALDQLCSKHDIKYFVYYGTLLGAVRHQGFIPWDDDIDIVMYREEYDKLIACREELESYFHIINIDVSCMYPPRFINTYYTCMDEDFLKRFHYCPYPTGMDIYVLDKTPQDPEEQEALKWLHQNARYVAQRADSRWKDKNPGKSAEVDIENVICQLEKATGYEFIRDDTIVQQMTRFVHCISATYNDEDLPYVARIHNWSIDGERECMPAGWFLEDEPVRLNFNGFMVPAPKQYHAILEKTMGKDYMTPKMFLNSHNYPVYKKYEEKLIEIYKQCNQEVPKYIFE